MWVVGAVAVVVGEERVVGDCWRGERGRAEVGGCNLLGPYYSKKVSKIITIYEVLLILSVTKLVMFVLHKIEV